MPNIIWIRKGNVKHNMGTQLGANKLKIGKLSNEVLKENILDKIKKNRDDVLLGAGIGEDIAAIDFGDEVCVLSMDPVTSSYCQVGSIAVHVSCNDIVSSGSEPVGILVTLLAPPSAMIEDIGRVMDDIMDAAGKLNVDVIGGHTEVTDAVNRIVVVSTVVGRVKKDRLISSGGARPGDSIIMTKWAGIEGTSIIASDCTEKVAEIFGAEFAQIASDLKNYISVVPEGMIAAASGVVNAMHDITEGGVLGAVWELAEASGCGAKIYRDRISIKDETIKICELFEIDPLKLISSGSMLIACANENAETLVSSLYEARIFANIIGVITEDKRKIIVDTGVEKEIKPPESDEIYKI
jgi:hydrogenase expression/formation protein HypE